jgi:hypothetical protein
MFSLKVLNRPSGVRCSFSSFLLLSDQLFSRLDGDRPNSSALISDAGIQRARPGAGRTATSRRLFVRSQIFPRARSIYLSHREIDVIKIMMEPFFNLLRQSAPLKSRYHSKAGRRMSLTL